MEKEKVIEILKRIDVLLKKNAFLEAKEYLNIELDNIQGKTQDKCKKTKYKFNFCKYCNNLNCEKNKLKY